MKRIIIDLSYTQGVDNIVTGIHLYGKEALKSLIKYGKNDFEINVLLLRDSKIDEWILESKDINLVYVNEKKYSKEYWIEVSKTISNYDIAFFPYQIIEGELKKYGNTKIYMTIHDMTPLLECRVNKINKYERLYKHGLKNLVKYYTKCAIRISRVWYLRRKNNLKNNVMLCDKIITVSEYSKNDIISFFNLDKDNVINCYSKSGKESLPKAEINSKLEYKDYYLLVSAGRYLKNAHMALYALDKMWSDKTEERPAIVLGNLSSSIIKRIKNKDKIIRMGYVSDDDLEYLYSNAYCFIFPSLSEGFGLPPLEAMKYGTKVACSKAMSLNELYPRSSQFDPYSLESITNAIKNLSNITKEQMIENYKEVVKKQEQFDTLLVETFKRS